MPKARSPGNGRTRSPRASPRGTRTRRRLPRWPVPRGPRASARRSCAERLGPAPDGPRGLLQTALTTLLEIGRCGFAERTGPRVGDAALDRPSDAGNESEGLPGHGPKAEAGADHSEDLDGAVAVDLLATGGGDAKDHADLVQRQCGQVGPRDEDGN